MAERRKLVTSASIRGLMILVGLGVTPLLSIAAHAQTAITVGNALDDETTVQALPGCNDNSDGPDRPQGPPPPVKSVFAASPGGVDMRSGSYQFKNDDLRIGTGDEGLTLTRTFSYDGSPTYTRQRLGKFFTHNWDVHLRQRRVPARGACNPGQYDYNVTINFANLGEGFWSPWSPIVFKQTSSKSGYAEFGQDPNDANRFVFTASDGTVVTFLRSDAQNCSDEGDICLHARTIRKPNGLTYRLDYQGTGETARLRSVVSSQGFALLFESNGGMITRACALNLSVQALPQDGICPNGTPAVQYSYAGVVQTSASLPEGGVWQFAQPTATSFTITRPGETAPFVTNSFSTFRSDNSIESLFVTNQSLASGATYTYQWDRLENAGGEGLSVEIAGGRVTDGAGASVQVRYGFYTKQGGPNDDLSSPQFRHATPGPVSVTDELGRVTRMSYCFTYETAGHCNTDHIPPMQNIVYPEGNGEAFQYTTYRNMVEATKTSKPGSGLGNLVEARGFPDAGASPAVRSKPTSVTNPAGARTDYGYDPVHGGVIYEMGPADANGVRPVVWKSYAQRYAWLAAPGGGFVRGEAPIWLVASESRCRTSATNLGDGSCAAGAADRVVTTYDYGPDNGSVGNNLQVRGVTVAADGQTRLTCFGYDGQGRRIWERGPRAGAGECY